ncbi:hypothetical protein [uncultured Chryseobacterium sp.]|nr:hypothetical protein [uncultured Chryseobacterium sp.]
MYKIKKSKSSERVPKRNYRRSSQWEHKNSGVINNNGMNITIIHETPYEMENLSENKELINTYLNLIIQQQFNMEIDLTDEYTFIENLVSRKPIIATTFSDKILSDPEIKMFLTSIITEINTGSCTIQSIKTKLRNYPESGWSSLRRII